MVKTRMSDIPETPPFLEKYLKTKEKIYKQAADVALDLDFVDGKIPAIERLCDGVEKEVCYMLATSHEYKKPNTKNSISFVKNYEWVRLDARTVLIEGIGKPVDDAKVERMIKYMRKPTPLVVVNQLNGIRPQTRGKAILFDGHHRLAAYKKKDWTNIPVYKGFYTGGDSITQKSILPKFPKDRRLSFAFDFDDTIYSKGSVKEDTVKVIKKLKAAGHLIILSTCRSGALLVEAEDFMKKNKIPYDTVNHNPDFSTGSPKMYADVTVDDRVVNVADVSILANADIPEWSESNGK